MPCLSSAIFPPPYLVSCPIGFAGEKNRGQTPRRTSAPSWKALLGVSVLHVEGAEAVLHEGAARDGLDDDPSNEDGDDLADALGSVGVIVSGLCVIWFDVYAVDGIVALLIAFYMIYQAVLSFPKVVNILMNAAPDHIKVQDVANALEKIEGISNVHHIHLWCINENDIALDCHLEAKNLELKVSFMGESNDTELTVFKSGLKWYVAF